MLHTLAFKFVLRKKEEENCLQKNSCSFSCSQLLLGNYNVQYTAQGGVKVFSLKQWCTEDVSSTILRDSNFLSNGISMNS